MVRRDEAEDAFDGELGVRIGEIGQLLRSLREVQTSGVGLFEHNEGRSREALARALPEPLKNFL